MTEDVKIPDKPITDQLALVRKIREIIQRAPERHYQRDWINVQFDDGEPIHPAGLRLEDVVDGGRACGTAFCIAGWAATLTGYEWEDSDMVRAPRGEVMAVWQAARKELYGGLGLDSEQINAESHLLFREEIGLTEILSRLAWIEARIVERREGWQS